MASVYTTKRGKNKKGKLGMRKDAANNAANKLSQKLFSDNPIEFAAALNDGGIKSLGSSATARRREALESARAKLQNLLTGSCGNGECPNKSNPKKSLLLCNGCKSRAYCDATCQRADWPNHKVACKEAQAKKAAEAVAAAVDKPAEEQAKPAANGTSASSPAPAPAPAAAAPAPTPAPVTAAAEPVAEQSKAEIDPSALD